MADIRVLIGWAIASGPLSACSGGYFSSSSHDGAEAGSAGTATASGEGGSRNPGPRGGAGERQRDGSGGRPGAGAGGEAATGGASSTGGEASGGETSATGGETSATGGETSATGGVGGTGGSFDMGGTGAGGKSEPPFEVTMVRSNTSYSTVSGTEVTASFAVGLEFSELIDPEGLVVQVWLHPGWGRDDYRVTWCNDNADDSNPPSECHLFDGDPPGLAVEFVGGSDVDALEAATKVARADGGDVEALENYSYEPGGITEQNDRIGIYYRGKLIWGIEP